MMFRDDASLLARDGYYPTSQTWVPGQRGWQAFAVAIAIALFIVLVGNFVFIYMLIVKPDGTLTVTYELRAQQPASAPASDATLAARLTYDVPSDLPPIYVSGVAPDGAVWWGATPYQPEEMDGLVRFDGETWAQFLRGTGLAPHGESIAFAPDGSLWALVTGGLYVITPEAVAVAE